MAVWIATDYIDVFLPGSRTYFFANPGQMFKIENKEDEEFLLELNLIINPNEVNNQ